MKQGWEIKKLGEVCEIKPPKKEAKKRLSENDWVSFLPMEDLGVMDRTIQANKVRQLKDVVGSYTYFANNDLLLAKITPCFENGKLGIARNLTNGIGFGSSEYVVFRSNSKVSEEYLFYYLAQEIFRDLGKKNMTGAVGHKRVSREFIENYEIPLPPLPEQKRIVSILDECFAAIEQSRNAAVQNLKNTKELFESYLQGVFGSTGSPAEKKGEGWVEKKLGEIYDVRDGTHDSPKYQSKGYPLVTSKNLKNHEVVLDDIKFISETDYININKRSKVDVGDVLFAMIGTIGNPVVIKEKPSYAIKNVALFKVNKEQDSYFLKYFLDSKQTIEKMTTDAKGTTQKFVGLGYLRNFPILIPRLEDQQTIVRQLDALRAETQKLEAIYQKKIADLEELKKSILQKAFAGELRGGEDIELSRNAEQKTEKLHTV